MVRQKLHKLVQIANPRVVIHFNKNTHTIILCMWFSSFCMSPLYCLYLYVHVLAVEMSTTFTEQQFAVDLDERELLAALNARKEREQQDIKEAVRKARKAQRNAALPERLPVYDTAITPSMRPSSKTTDDAHSREHKYAAETSVDDKCYAQDRKEEQSRAGVKRRRTRTGSKEENEILRAPIKHRYAYEFKLPRPDGCGEQAYSGDIFADSRSHAKSQAIFKIYQALSDRKQVDIDVAKWYCVVSEMLESGVLTTPVHANLVLAVTTIRSLYVKDVPEQACNVHFAPFHRHTTSEAQPEHRAHTRHVYMFVYAEHVYRGVVYAATTSDARTQVLQHAWTYYDTDYRPPRVECDDKYAAGKEVAKGGDKIVAECGVSGSDYMLKIGAVMCLAAVPNDMCVYFAPALSWELSYPIL